MTPSEKVRTDKLSSQVRKMVGEWHKGPQSESFATPRHVMAMCADALESLLPQIEALEQISSPQPSLGKDSPAKRDSDTQAVAPKSGDGLVLCGLDIASDAQIEHMVDRFLGWPLPKNFNPDAGISFRLLVSGNAEYPYPWPTGTNLFDSLQAEDMVRYMLEGIETPALLAAEEKRLGQLDIILRETEQVDDEEEAFLANDYGGTGWECEEIMNKIRIAVNRWKNKAKAADKGSNSIVLHGVDAEKFAETLLNPPAPNEALRAAAARSREDELLRTAYELFPRSARIDQLTECINTLKARDAKIRKLLGNMEHAKIYREGARQDHQLFPDTGDECLVCQILALLDGQPEEGKRG